MTAVVILLAFACGALALWARGAASPIGAPLNARQHAAVKAALALMQSKGLTQYARLGGDLDARGKWVASLPGDRYLAASRKAGDTPLAYTMPDDKHPKQPVAIVLAPDFFANTTPAAQAATMIHEMGHWQAFTRTGASTEYDGYKAEFDAHKRLGLSDKDGLTYFMMLDGVEENVAPKDKSYASDPEIKAYLKESGS